MKDDNRNILFKKICVFFFVFVILILGIIFVKAQLEEDKSISISSDIRKSWNFIITPDEKQEVNISIEQINLTTLEIVLDEHPNSSTNNNYKWDMALCNLTGSGLQYLEEDAQGGFNNSVPLDVSYGKLTDFGLNETWCGETNGEGYVLFSSGSKNSFPKRIRLLTNNITNFKLFAGTGSVQVDAATDSFGTAYSLRNFCQDNTGEFHITFRDSGNDLWYGNSTDGGNTWTTKEIDASKSYDGMGINCLSSGNLTILATDENIDVSSFTSDDNGVTWDGPNSLFSTTEPESSHVIDSNNIIHIIDIGSGSDLFYANSSSNYNIVEIVDAVTVDDLSITTDSNDNLHVFYSDTITDGFHYLNSTDGGNTWSSVEDITGDLGVLNEVQQGFTSSIVSDENDFLHSVSIANDDLYYCNNTIGSWNCIVLNDTSSYHQSQIYVTQNNDLFVFFSDTENSDGNLYYANTSDFNNWDFSQAIHTSASFLKVAQSPYPAGNNITDTLHYIYTDSGGLYYSNFSVDDGIVEPINYSFTISDSIVPTTTINKFYSTNKKIVSTTTFNFNLDYLRGILRNISDSIVISLSLDTFFNLFRNLSEILNISLLLNKIFYTPKNLNQSLFLEDSITYLRTSLRNIIQSISLTLNIDKIYFGFRSSLQQFNLSLSIISISVAKNFVSLSQSFSIDSTINSLKDVLRSLSSTFGFEKTTTTTIQLQDNETENVADLKLEQRAITYNAGIAFIKFNISSISNDATIDNTSLSIYVTQEGGSFGGQLDVFRAENQSWDEGFSGSDMDKIYDNQLNNQTIFTGLSGTGWYDLSHSNITNMVDLEFNSGNNYVTFVIDTPSVFSSAAFSENTTTIDIGVTTDDEEITITQRDYSTTSQKPYINITYSTTEPGTLISIVYKGFRKISQTINFNLNINIIKNSFINILDNITLILSITISSIKNYIISLSESINFNLLLEDILNYFRDISQTINFNLLINKTKSVFTSLSDNINFGVIINKIFISIKSLSDNINLVLSFNFIKILGEVSEEPSGGGGGITIEEEIELPEGITLVDVEINTKGKWCVEKYNILNIIPVDENNSFVKVSRVVVELKEGINYNQITPYIKNNSYVFPIELISNNISEFELFVSVSQNGKVINKTKEIGITTIDCEESFIEEFLLKLDSFVKRHLFIIIFSLLLLFCVIIIILFARDKNFWRFWVS